MQALVKQSALDLADMDHYIYSPIQRCFGMVVILFIQLIGNSKLKGTEVSC